MPLVTVIFQVKTTSRQESFQLIEGIAVERITDFDDPR